MNARRLMIITMATVASVAMADIKPAGLFTDNMVIQRDTQAAVWGWGDAGEKVTVGGSWGKSASTTVDKAGKWQVKLQTPAAGGPFTLTIKGNNTVEINNVLSGDVWLCSGQSNMAWPVSKANNPDEEVAKADYPHIRSFMVGRAAVLEEASDCNGAWVVCASNTVKNFSATAYFTGRELHKDLKVPIGLLTSCWGGTCVEAWTPLAAQTEDPFASESKAASDVRAKGFSLEQAKAQYEQQLKTWEDSVAAAKVQKKRAPRRPRLKTDPRLNQNYPANLYNGMIHPLLPFAIKGAMWYQGERNAKALATAEHYRVQLDRMVRCWRTEWGQDIPFYAVQLPNFKKEQVAPVESDNIWPVIRESFVHVAQNTPSAYTTTTIDIGEAKNIHPKNKQDVGFRLASTILNKTYGRGTPTTPFMKSFAVEGSTVVVSFDYTGSGLMAKGGELKGFAIAGPDKTFVWADAAIAQRDGEDCVEVSAAAIKDPAAVRYAWADNPVGCSLYSTEGFPASPFRTDTWDLTDAQPAPAKAESLGGKSLKQNDRIVFLGDSITAAGVRPGGYVTLTSQAISNAYAGLNIETIGAGKGGHKVPDCQRRLDSDVLQKKPTIVLIYIGINDVWHWTHPRVVARGKKGTTPEDFENGLKDMIGKINAVGARVILCTPTVIGEKTDGSNPDDKMLDQYSDISRKVAKESGSQLLDLRKAFITYLKEHNPENAERGILTGDSVHMNAQGNRLLSTLVLEALSVP
ncbi:MAG: hypothetical protein HN341_17660 [Verrucomicrobia bacterium]|jgi:sialate O-acetylesterase|nr:hypothetical protein [Verrucomicrobiota bacterium]